MRAIGFIFAEILLCHLSTARHLIFNDSFRDLNVIDLFRGRHGGDGLRKPKLCTTTPCRKTGNSILESIDPDVDPCEDFYTYACGNWIKNHPVPRTEFHWNQYDILDQKLDSQIHELLREPEEDDEPEIVKGAKKVYRACMDTDRIEKRGLKPLLDLLEEFGGWPMVTKNWNQDTFNWQKTIGDLGSKLGINSLLLVYSNADQKNTSRNVLIVDEPDLDLPRFGYGQSGSEYLGPYTAYIGEAADLLARAKGERLFPLLTRLNSYGLVGVEVKIESIMRDWKKKRSAEDLYHLVTIRELQDWTDQRVLTNPKSRINWKYLIENYGKSVGLKVKDDTPIVVTDWNYLDKLMKLVDTTQPIHLANYILWRVVNLMSRDLNRELLKLNFKFKRQFLGVREDYPRWRDCVATSGHLSFVVGYMYVRRHFSGEAKMKAVEMVNDIRSAFKQELSEVPWMDEATRKQAIEKADSMNDFIGYPKWYENVTAVEEYYAGVKLGEDHFENKVNLREVIAKGQWSDLEERTDREKWDLGPAIVNAFYNLQLNSIIFPAGVLQKPFFDKDQPAALNYGSIGAVVGHEISHGFDYMGRQSDKFGNIKQWWSRETEKTYLENARCFINQYERYRVPELDALLGADVTMNGVMTLDENIADNGGLRAALRAYHSHKERTRDAEFLLPGLEDFTPEQLFYIGFARVWCESQTTTSLLNEVLGDTHAPHRLRVIGSLSNSEDFATAWRCKLGSNMNPKTKCKLCDKKILQQWYANYGETEIKTMNEEKTKIFCIIADRLEV